MLRSFSRIAVQAAEQIIELTTGKDKKTYAMDLVK
jgi:ferritin-like protein